MGRQFESSGETVVFCVHLTASALILHLQACLNFFRLLKKYKKKLN